ncbi:MAG: hypothetical protein M3340_16915, partial [Actinomycetota bacterium]|nr:hypothetical protein [Actinomycetota bacterium]
PTPPGGGPAAPPGGVPPEQRYAQQQPPPWQQQGQYTQQQQQQQWPPPQQYGGSPYGQQSPWAATYYYSYAEPSNTPAVAGFIMSIASIGTLVMFFGLISPLTLGVSIASTIVSRNGVRKVEKGETRKNGDLAKWGYWLGIVGIVLSILAAAAWIALIASDPDMFDDTTPRDRGEPVSAAIALVAGAARLLGGL